MWDPRFLHYDFGSDHPFSERSRGLAVDLLRRELGTAGHPVSWSLQVPPASRSALERFHDAAYLDLVERAGGLEEPILLDAGDTPSFPGCFEEAARMVAGARSGVEWTRSHGRPAFHPAGGLHHAHPDRASGFCIFNDVALAVATAVDAGDRVAYIDIDAHHGDGVMYGYYDSGRVLDIDFHQDGRSLFPGTGFPPEVGEGDGAGLKVNVPLPPGAGDEALLPLFRRIVPPLLEEYRPQMIVLQHGVDGHAGDPLAQLQFTSKAYAEVDRIVLGLATRLCRSRLLVTGGGGYRAESVSRVLARAGRLLCGLDEPDDGAPVPDDWRWEFQEAVGYPAPVRWADPEELRPTPWRTADEEKLVAALEASLGRRLPAVGS